MYKVYRKCTLYILFIIYKVCITYTFCTLYTYYMSVLRTLYGFIKEIIVFILLAILYALVYDYRVDMLI